MYNNSQSVICTHTTRTIDRSIDIMYMHVQRSFSHLSHAAANHSLPNNADSKRQQVSKQSPRDKNHHRRRLATITHWPCHRVSVFQVSCLYVSVQCMTRLFQHYSEQTSLFALTSAIRCTFFTANDAINRLTAFCGH